MRSAELTPIRYEALSAPGDQTEKKITNLLLNQIVVFVANASSLALTFSAISLCLLLALLLLEFHVAKVHDGSNYFIAAVLLIGQEAEDVHGIL